VALTGATTVGLPASCAGWGDFSASLGGAGSAGRRSASASGFAGAFAVLWGLCIGDFTGGFFFESIFGVDGSEDSFDTDAVRVAFGFGVPGAGAGAVEAGLGAVAIGRPSGLIACEAADGTPVFGASAKRGVEGAADGAVAIGAPSCLIACEIAEGASVFGASARGSADGAVAIVAPSGLIACEPADGASVFGASAGGGAESGEAAPDGAAAIGAPSRPILCEATSVAGRFGGGGVISGAAEREELEASGVVSFCGLTWLSVAATGGSRSGRVGALFTRAKLTEIAAAPASTSPPAIHFQGRDLDLLDLGRSVRGPIDLLTSAFTGRSLLRSVCGRELPRSGELDLETADAEGS
jgi:hypothetical protein